MAATKIADVVVPEVFNPYVRERTSDLARFYMGGIVSSNPALDALASAGGKLINMPFWNDLTGDDEVLSDAGALTVNPISSGQDIAVLNMRGKAWGVNDLAKALAGSDPMKDVANLVADYWARKYRTLALNSLTGVFLDNVAGDSGDMIAAAHSETLSVDPVNFFSGDVFVDGQATFGDSIGNLAGIAFHPTVYHNMKKLDAISFQKSSQGDLEVETYRGLRVIVDASIPTRAGTTSGTVYTTYLFGDGAIGLGQGGAPVPSETDRDSLAGEDVLITRSHFIMHPRGVAFISGSVAGSSPTNAEHALAANWNRVYERNNVRIAAITTNG